MIDAVLTLFPLVLIGGSLMLWIAMLIHAVTAPIPDKIVWILVLVFMNTFGAAVYYFRVYYKMPRENQNMLKKWTIIVTAGTGLLVAFITILALVAVPAPTTRQGSPSHSASLKISEQRLRVNTL